MPAETERKRQKCSLYTDYITPGDRHTRRLAHQEAGTPAEQLASRSWGMDAEPRLWGLSGGALALGRSLQASGNWKQVQSLCPDSELGPQAEGSDASVNLSCSGLGSYVNR